MSITIKQLEAFVWVAELRSFRGAAERLNTTQPNVSARISSLESLLGQSLFDRNSGSVNLTFMGRELLPNAQRVLNETDSFIAASKNADLVDGVLRLGVTEMIVQTWLRDYLAAIKAAFPNLSIELTVDMSAALERQLADRIIDLALQNGPFLQIFTGNIDLGKYELIWVSSPEISNDMTSKNGSNMAKNPILTHARGTRNHAEILDHFQDQKAKNIQLVPSSTLAACQQMALDGMGITALPYAMVKNDLIARRLVQLPYRWVPEPLHFWARYHKDRATHVIERAAQIAGDIYDKQNLSK